jgi:hypothetical protein
MIYIYGPVRFAFDVGSIHYLGKLEGVGPWKSRLLKPKWLSPIGLMPFHRAQKSLDFRGPLTLALVMDAARIKSITHGAV